MTGPETAKCPNGHDLRVVENEFVECERYGHSARASDNDPWTPECDFPQLRILDLVGIRARVEALATQMDPKDRDTLPPIERQLYSGVSRKLREALNEPKEAA